MSDVHLSLRSLIGLATREYATRRTLVSSRRKQTCTQLKRRWMLPMCRHRLARPTLRQRPTQVPRAPSHLPTFLSLLINRLQFLNIHMRSQTQLNTTEPHSLKENPHSTGNVLSSSFTTGCLVWNYTVYFARKKPSFVKHLQCFTLQNIFNQQNMQLYIIRNLHTIFNLHCCISLLHSGSIICHFNNDIKWFLILTMRQLQ